MNNAQKTAAAAIALAAALTATPALAQGFTSYGPSCGASVVVTRVGPTSARFTVRADRPDALVTFAVTAYARDVYGNVRRYTTTEQVHTGGYGSRTFDLALASYDDDLLNVYVAGVSCARAY